jgi:hypothetical protein
MSISAAFSPTVALSFADKNQNDTYLIASHAFSLCFSPAYLKSIRFSRA